MRYQLRNFREFVYGQYFSDGIKITIGVLLPSLIFFQFDYLLTGITISLGALCVSIADNPGPVTHRRNGMLYTNIFIFFTALLTGNINHNSYLLGLEILVLCFLFSMFHIYGSRAASVGTAALLIMILNTDPGRNTVNIYEHALLILSGGVWYLILSLLLSGIWPYRYAQQTLGECTHKIAAYMRLRSRFYNEKITVEDNFKSLVDQQVIVNEHLDEVREILFKTRKLIHDSTKAGRILILIFVDMVDLFEQTMATNYDYDEIRKQYKDYDILPEFAKLIVKLADEIDYLGSCLIHNEKPRKHIVTLADLDTLKFRIDELEKQGVTVLVLKKILINLRNIFNRADNIFGYFAQPDNDILSKERNTDLEKFVNHQEIDPKLFISNISFKSATFRYAARVALVCFIGFLAGKLLPVGHHSYWILLTILVILKPGFSLTKQRNYERVIGTIIGGVAGGLILYFVEDINIRFGFMVVFMLLTYSFIRIRYFISVMFMTPFILILFSFISTENNIDIAKERIIDTLIGSGIAIISSYFVLPSWESFQFKNFLVEMLKANINYLKVISSKLGTEPVGSTEYKLARKEVYLNTANLAAAFQRMLSEPKNKQLNTKEVHKFVVLNHILSSYLANLSISIQPDITVAGQDQFKLFRKAIFSLNEAALKLGLTQSANQGEFAKLLEKEGNIHQDSALISDQLNLILKVSQDINKISDNIH